VKISFVFTEPTDNLSVAVSGTTTVQFLKRVTARLRLLRTKAATGVDDVPAAAAAARCDGRLTSPACWAGRRQLTCRTSAARRPSSLPTTRRASPQANVLSSGRTATRRYLWQFTEQRDTC